MDEHDETFEMMYADELELLKDHGEDDSAWIDEMANHYEEAKQNAPKYKSKRALDFSNCDTPEKKNGNSLIQPVLDVHLDQPPRKRPAEVDAEGLPSLTSKKARLELEEDRELSPMPVESPPPSEVRRRKIPKNDFISVTGLDGTIVYVEFSDPSKKTFEEKCRKYRLLPVSVSTMKSQIFEEEAMKTNSTSELRSAEDFAMGEAAVEDVTAEERLEKKLLWVDKYSPRGYSDLISEEATNRSLLRWLKLWDHSTFGIEPKAREVAAKEKKAGRKFQWVGPGQGNEPIRELDKNNRPLQKVALISGPPGFGKTTLAHVIARHAGYNVVEMNASDDRAVEVFREKIEAATQMKAVMGRSGLKDAEGEGEEPRPNCLIIDEIDGAPQPAVDVLLEMIKRSDPSMVRTAAKSARKKRGAGSTVLRPIVCICNDLYVPSLRQLRQVCFQVHFHAPHSSSLTGRLMEISRMERIKADASALAALCEKAENDIRSCINTLQFIKLRCSGELKAELVSSLSLGQKDFQRNLFSAWVAIFTLPKPVKAKYFNPNYGDKNPEHWDAGRKAVTPDERFRNVLQMASSAEEAKVNQGLFENYLSANVKDPKMTKVGQAIDWLCESDLLGCRIATLQDYSLMRYQPFASVLFHFLFAVNRPNKIVFPKSNFEFQTNLSCSREILSTFVGGSTISVRSCSSDSSVVMDTIPYLTGIIQPNLRPVNIHLYTSHEKCSLARVVHTMMSHGLSYRQEKNAEGQYNYVLEPNIEKLSRFSDSKPQKQMSYSCKQMISREIELERLRTSEGTQPSKPFQANKPSNASHPPKARETTKGPKMIKETKGPVDFFGRRIEPRQTSSSAQAEDKSNVQQDQSSVFGEVWFKYKEGFSNAVRRTSRIRDFL